ncbi:MAG: hypothetical protein HY983_03170 [Candidatus Magasanikbacteria bacterium]|nr:hypothetical protein [Candidatus Magasanikbacteria bacterium]
MPERGNPFFRPRPPERAPSPLHPGEDELELDLGATGHDYGVDEPVLDSKGDPATRWLDPKDLEAAQTLPLLEGDDLEPVGDEDENNQKAA